jgi:ribosome biogenesis GTPase
MNQPFNDTDTRLEGVVVSSTGSWYEVTTSRGVLNCRIRGKLRLKGIRSTNPVVVGDRVMVEPDEQSNAIVEILPRRNYVIRRASNLSKESHIIAANIDRALLIVTLHAPTTPREFVDRFLVTCEAYKVPVTIVLGKADTLVDELAMEAEEFEAIYGDAGYEVLRLSSNTGEGVEEIRAILHNHTTLVAGNSGVGKSTLVRAIDPTLDIRTGEISESHHKGKHTTTFSTMYPIEGGYIIDTPGIKGFGLIDIDGRELCRYFPEMMRLAPDCRFYNCTHTHEPGCAVSEAVKEGIVAWSRYESYLKILDEDDKYRK